MVNIVPCRIVTYHTFSTGQVWGFYFKDSILSGSSHAASVHKYIPKRNNKTQLFLFMF